MRKRIISMFASLPLVTFAMGGCSILNELDGETIDPFSGDESYVDNSYDDGSGSGSTLGDLASNAAWFNAGAGDWSGR